MTETEDLFRYYYRELFGPELILIPNLKFRHFRFQVFSKTKRFVRLKDVVQSKKELYRRIAAIVPVNAYFTPTRWLCPIFVSKTRGETDVLLFSSLYFDVDSDILNPASFDQAKVNTQCLIYWINDNYHRSPDLVVFSGRRGFHIYYWDWDTSIIRNMLPHDRIKNFVIERKRLLRELSTARITVDEAVTIDPYRLMRIPNTLHGKTGMIARVVEDLNKFDPLEEALAFEREVYLKTMKIDLKNCF